MLPHDRVQSVVNNIGLPNSGINITYGNSGTIGVFDIDMLVTLTEGDTPNSDYVKMLRAELPKAFPAATFAFLPADMVSQILNFGAPAPLDVQILGGKVEANRAYAAKLLTRIRHVPGIADPRIQEPARNPALSVAFNRELGGVVGLTEQDASTNIQTTLSGSTQTSPTYWFDPSNGVSYSVSVQTPQYSIDTMSDLKNVPLVAPNSTQLLGGLADITPEPLDSVVDHYDVKNTINIFATNQDRDLGGVIADVQKILDDTHSELPKGSTVTIRGQAVTMSTAYNQLLIGLGFSIVLIYLLIVINFQSWVDAFVIVMALPAALAGIVWMLFVTMTHVSVPALTGAIMCMGVATANSILVVSFAREQLRDGKDAIRRRGRRRRDTPSTRRHDRSGDDDRHGTDGDRAGAERTFGPRRDRRSPVRDDRDPFLRAGRLQPGARSRAPPNDRRTPACTTLPYGLIGSNHGA